MSSNKYLRFLIALTILATVAFIAILINQEPATGRLKGRVLADDSGSALSGNIYLRPANDKYTVTDSFYVKNGSFDFAAVEAGKYTLEFISNAHHINAVNIRIIEGKTTNLDLEAVPDTSRLSLNIHQNIFTPEEVPQVTCNGFVSVDKLQISIYKVDMNSFLFSHSSSLQELVGSQSYWNPNGGWMQKKTNLAENHSLSLVSSFNKDIAKRNTEGEFVQRIDLIKLDTGLYVVESKADGNQALGWIMVTNLGLVTKRADNNLTAFVVDLKTGIPIADATVSIFSRSKLLIEAKSDKNGLVKLDLPQDKASDSNLTIVARSNNSTAFVSTWYNANSSSNALIYSYTERPVYRPGQTVFFKGIIRRTENGTYKKPGAEPIEIEITDSKGTLIYKTSKKTTKSGSYFGSFKLDSETGSGYYNIVTTLPNKNITNSTGFIVASYKKPEYSVKVSFSKKRYTRGDTIIAKIHAEYYFGSPVTDANVNYSIRRSAYWMFDTDEDIEYSDEYDGYGEWVTDGNAITDKDGNAEVQFKANWESSDSIYIDDTDQIFTVEAEVTDKSNSWVSASGDVPATRGMFALNLTPEKYVAQTNESVELKIQAIDFKKKPVKDTDIKIIIGKQIWDNETSNLNLKEYQTYDTTTNSKGEALVKLASKHTGSIYILATAHDTKGNKITAAEYIWISNDKQSEDTNYVYPKLEIITDKKTYKPGENAEVIINSSVSGISALVSIEGDKLYNTQVINLKTKTTKITVPIKDNYKPNFYISVCYVKNKSFESNLKKIKVSINLDKINVSVKPNKSIYLPGELAEYTIITKNGLGKPISAELSVGLVDEAIYAIAKDSTEPILNYFYNEKPNNVNTNFSFPEIYLSDPDKAGSTEKKITRKKFVDTAYWNPIVNTDQNGTAKIKIKLPDNITSWRMTTRAISDNTSCGEAVNNITVRKPIMVRLETPRFLIQSDHTLLSAIVHNYTKEDKNVRVKLFKSKGLEITGEQTQNILIKSNSNSRIDWEVYAKTSGNKTIKVEADAGDKYDAMQISLPVNPHAFEKQTVKNGSINSTQTDTFNLNIRKDAILPLTKLKLRFAPSIASTMLGSLDYLAQYPYGCAEQTMSAILPDMIISDFVNNGLPKAVSNEKKQELKKMVNAGLLKLYNSQNSNGGWGWCEYGEIDPWMTAYVCYGFIKANEHGYSSYQTSLASGLRALEEQVNNNKIDTQTRAFCAYVLMLAKKDSSSQLEIIANKRNLSSETLALLTLAYAERGNTANANELLGRLYAKANSDGVFTYWLSGDVNNPESIMTTALALQATLKLNPNDPRAQQIVQWLMSEKQDNHWYSTRDTAFVLIAMNDYLKLSKELSPDYKIDIKVNGHLLSDGKSIHFGKDSLFMPELAINVPSKLLKRGANKVEIIKSGEGVLYYSARISQLLKSKNMAANLTDSGMTINRQYFNTVNKPFLGLDIFKSKTNQYTNEISSCNVLDVINVRLVITSTRRQTRLLVEDIIPAGFEIIDRGNVDYYDWENWWIGQDIKDDRISFYLDILPRGRQVIDYKIRASTQGTYHALPARIFAMYQPAISARTAEQEFTVR